MKIIKRGNVQKLKKIKTFSCGNCGCVFEADNTEYDVCSQYNEIYCQCKCPCCNKTVYRR